MGETAFKFRLQKLLDLKEKQQRALEIELAGIERAMAIQEAELDRWQRVMDEVLHKLREARENSDLELNGRYSSYLPYVRAHLKRCRLEIVGLKHNKTAVRQQLEGLMQSRKILENYRDRLMREFLVDQERAEEKALDLHSLQKFIQGARRP